ncbi:MAG: GNAT family N-acetyltransferase [Leptolyngbyaceae cyanobacterium]
MASPQRYALPGVEQNDRLNVKVMNGTNGLRLGSPARLSCYPFIDRRYLVMNLTTKVSTVNIRAYESTDWSRLCEIHDASRLDELRLTVGVEAFLTLEQTAENEGLFADKLVVAEVDGVVQGFVAYSETEITWLYVNPQVYKQGVGRSLIRHTVADSTSAIELEVLEGNIPALKLYLSEGYKIIKRSEGKLVGNEEFAASGLVLRHEPSAQGSAL